MSMILKESVILPCELAGTRPEESSRRLPVAGGLYTDTGIVLYNACFEGLPQVSVFVYPNVFNLTPEHIMSRDHRFSNLDFIVKKEFRDFSLEDVNMAFLEQVKPLVPFISKEYALARPRFLEHSFYLGADAYIKPVVADLKVD